MKKIVLLIVIGLAVAGCNSVKPAADKNLMVLHGRIEALGMSTFQYGTHTLKTNDKLYALKSSKVDLKSFEGKDVVVKGLKIAGYPVDGGPEFIDVKDINTN